MRSDTPTTPTTTTFQAPARTLLTLLALEVEMNHPLSRLLPAAALLTTLAGCPQQACTLLYAPDNVVVDIQADAFADGEWVVSVGDAACTLTLPGTESDMVCTESVQQLYLTLSADGTAITEAMLVESAPASLDIELQHDGSVVFSDTVSPTYTEQEPNGEGCGVSRFGTASISLDG